MIGPEQPLQAVKNAVAESYKMPISQPPTFHLQTEATVPIGPVVAKVELGVSVEDGEVKPEIQAKLEGLLVEALDTATGQKRKSTRHAGRQSQKVPVSPSGKGGRGHRDRRPR